MPVAERKTFNNQMDATMVININIWIDDMISKTGNMQDVEAAIDLLDHHPLGEQRRRGQTLIKGDAAVDHPHYHPPCATGVCQLELCRDGVEVLREVQRKWQTLQLWSKDNLAEVAWS